MTVADKVDLWSVGFSSAATSGLAPSSGRRTAGKWSGIVDAPAWSEGIIRGGDRNNHLHIPSGTPLRGVEGADEQE